MLPLSGQPEIVAPLREVPLGGGSADVLAFEASGRPVVIEAKLSKNPEAKRAVVAQTLAYAAWLHGATVEELEKDILQSHLAGETLATAVEESNGRVAFDPNEFYANLAGHLAEGSFRLVIVLDDAPAQLVRLTGYLEEITTDRISVDLVTVSAYEVNGAQILVPQRIDAEREPEPDPHRPSDRPRPSRRSKRTREAVSGFRLWGTEHQASTWTDVWEGVAQALYDRDPDKFSTVTGSPNGNRSYVEKDKAGLSSSAVNSARQVGPYWIECNASAEQIRSRCLHLLELCDFSGVDLKFLAD